MRNRITRLVTGFFIALLLMNHVMAPMGDFDADQVEAQVLTGRVSSAVLKIRKKKGTSGKTLKILHYNDRVTVLSTGKAWVKVRSGSTIGYARGKMLDTGLGGTAADEGGCAKGRQVANFALRFVGNPYVWGGTSLTRGADCSGFIMSVYRHFGVNLPHSSTLQRRYGKRVPSLKLARAGDIICYKGHVALYLGKKRIVHASGRKTGIKVSPDAAYRQILAIRRIF